MVVGIPELRLEQFRRHLEVLFQPPKVICQTIIVTRCIQIDEPQKIPASSNPKISLGIYLLRPDD